MNTGERHRDEYVLHVRLSCTVIHLARGERRGGEAKWVADSAALLELPDSCGSEQTQEPLQSILIERMDR